MPLPDQRQRWLILIAMTGSLSMISLDQTVVTVALPTMTRELHLSVATETWVVNAYVLAMATLVAIGGKIGDVFGLVTAYRLGISLFFLASLGCGLAPHGDLGASWILVARALQGAGAALMLPASGTIVLSSFPPSASGRAMAVYAGISQLFLAVGPLLGGVLTQLVSWRAVFFLNIPVGVAALALVRVAKPANTRQTGIFSPAAAFALAAGLVAFVLAIQEGSRWSWASPRTIGVLAAGVAIIAVFARSQLRSRDPLVNVRLLARRPFRGDVAVAGCVQFGLLGVVLYGSLYLQDLLGLGPIRTGLAVLVFIIPFAGAAQIGGRWYDAYGVRRPVLVGLSIAVVGLAGWTAALPTLGYAWQVPGMLVTGAGLGLAMSPTNTDALGRIEATQRNQASALVQTANQLGGTMGVAIIGAIVTSYAARATRGPSAQHAANAVTAGFLGATVAFAVALAVGFRLLSHDKIADEPDALAVAVA